MKKILLYHGTTANIDTVNLYYAKDKKDFGKGFYTTTDINQAINLSRRMKLREFNSGKLAKAYVYSFVVYKEELDLLNVHRFLPGSIAWVDYILKNRSPEGSFEDFDVVIGQVADANTQLILNKFISTYGYNASIEDKKRLVQNLKPNNLVDQYCFKTNKAIYLLNKNELGKRREF